MANVLSLKKVSKRWSPLPHALFVDFNYEDDLGFKKSCIIAFDDERSAVRWAANRIREYHPNDYPPAMSDLKVLDEFQWSLAGSEYFHTRPLKQSDCV